MKNKLTTKQEKFIQNIVSGMSQRDAYKEAYNTEHTKDKTIDEYACRLFNNSKVKARYEELMQKLEDKSIMSTKDRMKLLTEIASGLRKEKDKVVTPSGKIVSVEKEANLTTIMKALDILNKMSGEYVQKIEADVKSDVNINIELSDE